MADKQPVALRLAEELYKPWLLQQPGSKDAAVAVLVRQHALIAELVGALEKACDEEQQARFEHWLAGEAPSGDVEDVQRQWLNSYAYQGYCDDWCRVIDALAKAKEAQQ